MYESTQDATWVHGIDLAQEPDFELGSLLVRPAKCEVEWNGANEILQRRVMQVLVALAHARGSVVSQDDLVMRCWRGLSVSDDAIFRCISKLRKLASSYPDSPFAIETIPGVGYRLTSSSLVEDHPTIATAPTRYRRFGLGALAAAAALAILIVVGSIIWIAQRNAVDEHHPVRVVVQPFETLSNSGDVRSLARRIPNEVVNALGDSQIEAVLDGEKPDKSIFSLIGRSKSGLIVTGIVRDDAHNMSVSVRVEDGATNNALWSTEFKRDDRQASDLPLEVAARVADVVNMVGFARSANPPLTDNSALSALLQTTDMIRGTPGGDWAQLLQHAQDIVARHPEFAFGHSVLAEAYAEASYGIGVPDRAKAMSEAARREANLTLKLDPDDAGAYAVLLELEAPDNYHAQEAIVLRGIKFAKHPKEPLGALYAYEGGLLYNVGRLREGLPFLLVAQAKDQWSPSKTSKLAFAYATLGNLADATSLLQKAMQRWPNHLGVQERLRYVAGFYEQPPDALADINRLDAQTSSDDGRNAIWRTFIEARAAHSERVTAAAIARIRVGADEQKIDREIEIMMLAALGKTQLAIDAANSALDHQILEPWFLFTPITREIRRDPAFVGLASRMGLIKYWHERGKLPDFCTDQARRSECSPQLLAAVKP